MNENKAPDTAAVTNGNLAPTPATSFENGSYYNSTIPKSLGPLKPATFDMAPRVIPVPEQPPTIAIGDNLLKEDASAANHNDSSDLTSASTDPDVAGVQNTPVSSSLSNLKAASFDMPSRVSVLQSAEEAQSIAATSQAITDDIDLIKLDSKDVIVHHQSLSRGIFRGKGSQLEGLAVAENLPALTDVQRAFLEKATRYSMDQSLKTHMLRKAIQNQQQQMVALKENIQKQQALTVMCTLYVGSISYECKEEHLKNAFGQFGPVKSANMTWDPSTGRHMGFSFVEFEVPEAAELALNQMNGMWLAGRNIRVGRPANQPQAQQTIDTIQAEARKFPRVYVANIHSEINEDDLKSVFEAFGPIKSCFLPRDQNPTLLKPGRHRGYGFIEYITDKSANEAIGSMTNFELGGQGLKVGRAITPPEGLVAKVSATGTASSAFVPASMGVMDANGGSNSPKPTDPAAPGVVKLPPPGLVQPQVITPKLYSKPSSSTVTSETQPSTSNGPTTVLSSETTSTASPGPEMEGSASTSAQEPTSHVKPPVVAPPAVVPSSNMTTCIPASQPQVSAALPSVGVELSENAAPVSSAAAEAASRAAQLLRSSDAVAQKLMNSSALGEKQKQLIEMEVSQSLAAQEDLKIKGNEARSVLMQKLMRRLESPVVVLRNMVGPEDLDEFLEEEINEECSKFGLVEKIVFYQEQGRSGHVENIKIFVKFSLPSEAETSKNALDGRYFGGRTVKGEIYDQSLFNSGDLTA